MKLIIPLVATLCIFVASRSVAFGQGPSPMIMYARLEGDRGIRFSTHSAVWKYSRHTDGYVGSPGSKVTDWTTSIKLVRGSTATGSPLSEADLRTKLTDKTLVVVSLSDRDVAPEFLKMFNQDALVLTIRDIKEIRKLLKIIGAEFEPGTENPDVTKR